MWKYYEDNICTDRPVAELFNNRDVKVLCVMESRDSYYTIPKSDIVKSYRVKYSDTANVSGETDDDSTLEVLKKRLKVACEKIEENYNKQLLNIVGNVIDMI